MKPLIKVHPRAAREAREARRYYQRASVEVAERFVAALDQAVDKIIEAAHTWMPYLHGTRAVKLRRFPYLIVYSESAVFIEIWAVAHAKRRPGYWRRRLKSS